MSEIGIGIVGGGYMGKAHSVAMASVGAVFNTRLRPRLEMIAAQSAASAERYRAAYGFRRGTDDWRALVADPAVEAVIIASPQDTHQPIAAAAIAAGKHVLCEKPLAMTLSESRAMARAAEAAGIIHATGFNYVRTPATQFARQLIGDGAIGEIVFYRGEHTEDFLADPALGGWRASGQAFGTMGDLAPHPINCALALAGPIASVMAQVDCVHPNRPDVSGPANDDQAQMMLRFASGAAGHIYVSRVAHGRKMGYIYEITGTRGALRFDQEDQNALWLYRAEGPEAERGFRKILTGPDHPDYRPFCQGPGHGTGYQDQIIIEAKDFLEAIAEGRPRFPDFHDGVAVAEVTEAAFVSARDGRWVELDEI